MSPSIRRHIVSVVKCIEERRDCKRLFFMEIINKDASEDGRMVVERTDRVSTVFPPSSSPPFPFSSS